MNDTLAVTAVVLALAGTARAEVKTGDHAVELDAQAGNGAHFRLKTLAGHWVLLSFNASWCEPCHKELPAWDRIAPRFAKKLLFVAVNINNNLEDGKHFLSSLRLKHIFPVYLPDENSPAMKAYDPSRMPSTFVIDPHGVVRLVEYGYRAGDEDKLAAKLSSLVH